MVYCRAGTFLSGTTCGTRYNKLCFNAITLSYRPQGMSFVSSAKSESPTLPGIPTNPFLKRVWRNRFAREGVPFPDEKTNPQTSAANRSLINKKKWSMARLLPGSNNYNTWNTMSLLNKGLSPLLKTGNLPGALAKAWQTVGRVFRGKPIDITKHVTPNLQGNLGHGDHWGKLLKETGTTADPDGIFRNISGGLAAPLLRGAGGAVLGDQFDDPNGKKISFGPFGDWGYGSLAGFLAGASSPHALRAFGSKTAPQNTIANLLSNGTLASRITTDPLARIAGGAFMGDVAEGGLDALGWKFDDRFGNGYGRRLGIGLGGLAGMRPAAQLLGGRYKTIGDKLTGLGNSRLGKNFTGMQTAGGLPAHLNLGSLAMGTHYAAPGGLLTMALAQGLGNEFIGKPLRSLSQKRQTLDKLINSEGTKPAFTTLEKWFAEKYPNTPFWDDDGLPSLAALQIVQQRASQGLSALSRGGDTYFNDPSYLFNPVNWSKIQRPDKLMYDAVSGQYQRAENWLRNLPKPANEL
jgi:hypothetical protein